jgi:hypothetical protein
LLFLKKNPIVAAVRQGHTYLYPASTQMTKKETSTEEKGTGPFSQFDFDYFDNKLYVKKNKSYDTSIKAGSEVIAVNGINELNSGIQPLL